MAETKKPPEGGFCCDQQNRSEGVADASTDIGCLTTGVDASTSEDRSFTQTQGCCNDVRSAHNTTDRRSAQGEACSIGRLTFVVTDLNRASVQYSTLGQCVLCTQHQHCVFTLGIVLELDLRDLTREGPLVHRDANTSTHELDLQVVVTRTAVYVVSALTERCVQQNTVRRHHVLHAQVESLILVKRDTADDRRRQAGTHNSNTSTVKFILVKTKRCIQSRVECVVTKEAN